MLVVGKEISLLKRFFVSAASAAIFSALAMAETWNGTIVDVMCKGRDLASHTRQCNLDCAKGGYGLVLSDGKFVKFNETGNAKALTVLKSAAKEKDLKAKVSGKLDGEIIRVESIEIQ